MAPVFCLSMEQRHRHDRGDDARDDHLVFRGIRIFQIRGPAPDRLGLRHDLCPDDSADRGYPAAFRSEEHTSELQSLMRISYAVFCLKKTTQSTTTHTSNSI